MPLQSYQCTDKGILRILTPTSKGKNYKFQKQPTPEFWEWRLSVLQWPNWHENSNSTSTHRVKDNITLILTSESSKQ